MTTDKLARTSWMSLVAAAIVAGCASSVAVPDAPVEGEARTDGEPTTFPEGDGSPPEPASQGDAGATSKETIDAAAPDAGADAGTGAGGGGAPPSTSCVPCVVTGPGTFCGMTVDITPFVTGGVFGGFQSQSGTGYQQTITITFSQSINWASVRILDPDYPANYIRVYDAAGVLTGQVAFVADGTPNVLTDSTQGLGGGLIRKIELVPDPLDYVAYEELTIVPAGCERPYDLPN